jgi:hypothetical protein
LFCFCFVSIGSSNILFQIARKNFSKPFRLRPIRADPKRDGFGTESRGAPADGRKAGVGAVGRFSRPG